jgi:hypothetical protein
MTVARMHSQRQVQRGRDKPRYTGQRPIERGGPPAAAIPTPVVTSVAPTSLAVGAPADVTFTGSNFVDGCSVATGSIYKFPTVFVSSTEVVGTFPCDVGGTYQAFVMNNPNGTDQASQIWSNSTDIPCA